MSRTCKLLWDFTHTWIFSILAKPSSTKFHEISSSGEPSCFMRTDRHRHTDGQTDMSKQRNLQNNNRFSPFCQSGYTAVPLSQSCSVNSWLQTSAAKCKITSLLWDFTQQVVLIPYRRFGTTYRVPYARVKNRCVISQKSGAVFSLLSKSIKD
jgi:hypothetical protein